MEAVVTHQFAEDCSSKVESLYYLTACITSLSAFLGLAFSIYAIKNSDNQEKTNALYMHGNFIYICHSVFSKVRCIAAHYYKFNANYTGHRLYCRYIY